MTPQIVRTEEREYTRLTTPIPVSGFSAQKLSRIHHRHFIRVEGSRLTSLPITGIVDGGSTMELETAPLKLSPIHEILRDGIRGPRAIVPIVRDLLALTDYDDEPVLCDSLMFLDENQRLVIPSGELGRLILENTPTPDVVLHRTVLSHPNLEGSEAIVFFAAALTYLALSGVPPIGFDTAASIDEVERTIVHPEGIIPLAAIRPSVFSEVSDGLDSLLVGTTPRLPEELWKLFERRNNGAGWYEPSLSEESLRSRRTDAEAVVANRKKRFNRALFFRIHGKRVLLIGVVALLLLLIPFQILEYQFRKPATTGLPPEAVVHLFFNAWNDLDQELLEETLARRVGRDIIREVSNIYVIDRVQEAYNQKSTIVDARDWIDAGEPEDVLPYGIVDLKITTLERDENTTVLETSYVYIFPDSSEEKTTIVQQPIQKRITLTNRGDYWEITAIDPY